MQGIAKAVVITIITSICIFLFINLAFFFPWYLTLVTETYSVSQMVASDNYLTKENYETSMERLEERPIFKDKKDEIILTVVHDDLQKSDAIEKYDNIDNYEDESIPDSDKPYKQRGKQLKITISAVYPLTVTLWGKKYEREVPVSFSMTTTGLKHYKDLPYDDYQ